MIQNEGDGMAARGQAAEFHLEDIILGIGRGETNIFLEGEMWI